ncbi:hypothetical protein BC628DRAFT_1420804 [Trametes gibbosa]|nr:hypothetical protein BC628DRAFT_1420804 [Trametes gibbosa]
MISIEIYTIPREQVDVEALANEWASYLKVNAIDTQVLSEHPRERDALVGELHAYPDARPSFWPKDIVGTDLPKEKYDEYLVQANAAITQLTPPKSLRDRVMRSHIAIAASMVFYQYRWAYGLQANIGLRSEVLARYNAIMNDWFKGEFRTLFPETSDQTTHNPSTTTPPAAQICMSTPPTRHSGEPEAITASEIAAYLKAPHTLLGKQFFHTPPVDEEQDDKGVWEAESYSMRKEDGFIDHEFLVRFEAFGGDLLPVGRDHMEELLTHSTLVV